MLCFKIYEINMEGNFGFSKTFKDKWRVILEIFP